MMEKYLNDTIASDRLADVERISNANLVPDAIKEWYVRKDNQRQARLAAAAAATKAAELNDEEENIEKNPGINKRQNEEQLEITTPIDPKKKTKEKKQPANFNTVLFIHADE
jgi:penicillin-binding protein 2